MNQKKRKIVLDSVLIGAALFSMFFGAGNMIFPPYLGFKAGDEWFVGFVGYYIADIGLAILAILALIKSGGNKDLLKPLGKIPSIALMCTIVLCIGPIISIPRTAATTYELSILPLANNFNMILFNIIFFAVVLLMCINRSAVVDIVGKILTPVLFAGLLFLIFQGIVNPIGDASALPRTESVIADGIEAGYQSMDVLGAIIFGVLVLNSAKDKGHTSIKQQQKVTVNASIVAGVGLLVVYLGLTYLGASVSNIYDMHTTRTGLLTNLITTLMPGTIGLVFFAVVAGLACLSTAIAITSSAAEYFEELFNGKVNYKILVIIICVFSTVLSCVGVEQLVEIASPILNIVYPPTLVVVVCKVFDKFVSTFGYRLGAGVSIIIATISTVSSFNINVISLDMLPFNSFGMPWLVPAIAAVIIGSISEKLINKTKKAV